MWDIGCTIATALFFIGSIAYTVGCDRLGTKEARS
jgi:hypothetical protein